MMAASGVGSCACCGASVAPPGSAVAVVAALKHCTECSARLSWRLGRGIAWLALAALTCAVALVVYLIFCLDSGAEPLFWVTLPAIVVATGALAHLILPRRASARPHACEGSLARALAAVPGPAPVLSLVTLVVAAAVGILAFPLSNEKVAWNRVLESSDARLVFQYARDWPDRRPESEVADLAWERGRQSPDAELHAFFLETFPHSQHVAEARQAIDRIRTSEAERRRNEEVRSVLSSGSAGACLDFLKLGSAPQRAAEVRGALLAVVEKRAAAEDKTPKAFRAIFAAGASGPVGVCIKGGTPEPWRRDVLAAIGEALSEFGLTAVETSAEKATMRFEVEMWHPAEHDGSDGGGWDALFRGCGRPLGATGTLSVQEAGAAEPAWLLSARSECGSLNFVKAEDADAEIESNVREGVCRELNAALRIAR